MPQSGGAKSEVAHKWARWLLLWAAILVGLLGGYFQLGSLPCIVCCILRFAYAYGVPGCVSVMTPPGYLHLSIRFYCFFFTVFAPNTPPPKARLGTSTYTEGIQIWKLKGALHACIFGAHIVGWGCWGFTQDRCFGSRHVSLVCIYVQKHS